MTKKGLIKEVSHRMDCTWEQAEIFLNVIQKIIQDEIFYNGEMKFLKIGSFKVCMRKARVRNNLHTGGLINVPETPYIRFKPSIDMMLCIKAYSGIQSHRSRMNGETRNEGQGTD